MSRTRAALIAAALTSALALGGCGGGDAEPKLAPVPSGSATSSSAESETTEPSGPVEPTMPPAAHGHGASAAKAFVKFYWAMLNYAQATGDVTELATLSHGCVSCDAAVELIRNSYGDGGSIRGGQGEVSDADVVFIRREKKSWAIVEFLVTSAKQTVLDADGAKVDRFPGGASQVRAYLEPVEIGWVVRIVNVS